MSMKNTHEPRTVKGLALYLPAKEPLRLLPEEGLGKGALTPVPLPHGSPLSMTPKKPTTYQGCRARKGLCILSFINIIIQG